MRWLRELDTTVAPALANACSISVATLASVAEKTSFGVFFPGLHSSTVSPAVLVGIRPSSLQEVASLYSLPAERSLAPTQVNSNHG